MPELRAACKSLGIKSTGKQFALLPWFVAASVLTLHCAGTKAELQVGILARFGLTSPASASHKLITHYKLHDVILAGWTTELATLQHTGGWRHRVCRSIVDTLRTYARMHERLSAQQCCHPLHGGWQQHPTRRLKAAGKARLADNFDSYSAMQQAVMDQRRAVAA